MVVAIVSPNDMDASSQHRGTKVHVCNPQTEKEYPLQGYFDQPELGKVGIQVNGIDAEGPYTISI
jgi:hypothetical protein